MTRKQARDIVFKLMYQAELRGENASEMLETFAEHYDEEYITAGERVLDWRQGNVNSDYVRKIIAVIDSETEWLDSAITELSRDWDVNRLSKMTLAALRYGIYELNQKDVHANIIISEMTDLIGMYEGGEAANYVNGVLARYSRGQTKNDCGN